jgi:L-aspartate oxidase
MAGRVSLSGVQRKLALAGERGTLRVAGTDGGKYILASNSLLECLVFGKRASEKAAVMEDSGYKPENINPVYLDKKNESAFLIIQNEIAQLMSENLGIVRNENGIKKALKRFKEIGIEYADHKNEYNLLKIRNTVSICTLVAEAALIRKESRGGHIREEYEREDPNFEVHSIQQKGEKIYFEKVRK